MRKKKTVKVPNISNFELVYGDDGLEEVRYPEDLPSRPANDNSTEVGEFLDEFEVDEVLGEDSVDAEVWS